ncbi:hypothetical protein [Mogibacterium diversum]|uniref:hypothetical protein n=1 Tax=Mogibacterium diversum TaxID=114527 RepID=UPI0028D72D23|nr:hypothetical protein [Mogibacterium diversum]
MINTLTADKVASDMIDMMMKQLGATSIKNMPAHINVYEFDINGELTIKYMLDLRRDHAMYLRRVTPYPMLLGVFYGETDVVDFIKRDIAKFRNASKTDKFNKFLELADGLTQFNREIEQLFLNRKVPTAAFEEFSEEMERIRATIEQIARDCPMLYDDERLIEDGIRK